MVIIFNQTSYTFIVTFQNMPSFSSILLVTGATLFSLAMVRGTSASPLKGEENAVEEQCQGTNSGSTGSGYAEQGSNMKNEDQHVKRQYWAHPSDIWA